MKISVVVPCYNMVHTISQTLESIWNQKFKDLELIVIDGASTDGTLEYLQEHKEKIDLIISEKDEGQYHAIQKGMSMTTGDVLCWLNADDVYFPWTFEIVSQIFSTHEDVHWISGMPAFLNKEGVLTNIYNSVAAKPSNLIKNGAFRKKIYGYLQQESMFWRKDVWQLTGGLDLQYKLAGDFKLWTTFAKKHELFSISVPLAGFRQHNNSRSKLMENVYEREVLDIIETVSKRQKLFFYFSKKSQVINMVLRLLTWRKGWVIFYSVSQKRWIKALKYRPISNNSFTQLMLEK